jgi:hypothetical protein
MTRSQIEAAILSGVPFTLRMADGREYKVPHRDYISLSPRGTFATVYDDEERFFVLPLLTMTGLVSTAPASNAGLEAP